MTQEMRVLDPGLPVSSQLAEVERLLLGAARSEVELLQDAATHILTSGGKRLRPMITLLVGEALGGASPDLVSLAAACELVHTATLVHDDVVDASDSRRGRMSVQFYYGNSASVLVGDYLVARAFDLVGHLCERRYWQVLVDTIARMCEGEVLQICVKGNTDLDIDCYERVIETKTALLMSSCARFGAMSAGAPAELVEAMIDFGYGLGMAFQIQDDILDFVGDAGVLGKPLAGDLRERKVTLPVIFGLRDAPAGGAVELKALYDKPGPLTAGDIEAATAIIRRAGGFDRAAEHARGYLQRSLQALKNLPPSAARDSLYEVTHLVVHRDA